ncbi:MAG TPA: HAMP domain-containing sensor histidine kinase, partial [Thermoanaerobaculia bacterium]
GPPSAVILQLDRDYLAGVWLPEIAKRYFHDEYDVVVSDHRRVVYRSSQWDGARPDATWPLFEARDPEGADARFTWRLLMRSRGAPLADAIALTRRRNLAISFAILAILIGSIAMLTVIARRANRQRVQQLEFVAGITHELNTPLAALASAGQNLADGVVRDGEQMKRYGSMIVKEARRLSETVAQVLDYAGLQAGGGLRTVAPIDVSAVIEDAVSHSRWLAEERRVQLEVQVPRELPSLDGDAAALGRALQNLIVNAIRHGGSGGWVGVRAVVDRGAICITVEDRGPGIPARDIDHLFEPFYRGRESGRVRGTGLGLTIVKQIANAHGGSVSIEKRRERGAAFTVKLPVRAAASHAEVAVV